MKKKRIVTAISALLTLGLITPISAFAKTSTDSTPLTSVIVKMNGTTMGTIPDYMKSNTLNIPLWYVMNMLNKINITSTWNGSLWSLSVPGKYFINSLNLGTIHGSTKIDMNGKQIGVISTFKAKDPFSGQMTTYLSESIIYTLLGALGINTEVSGHQWWWQTMRADLLIGAAASPAMGTGNGNVWFYDVSSGKQNKISLSTGANAFKMALDRDLAYIPTLQGKTYIINIRNQQVVGQFASIVGARIANLARAENLLILTGSHGVDAYSLSTHQLIWSVNAPGNALAVVGNEAYLSSNMTATTTRIDLTTGQILGTLPIGHIEDSVYDTNQHTLWLANWYTGTMTVVDTQTQAISAVIQTPEGDPTLTMSNIMASPAAFMQLAVGPTGQHVYAAGFSGHILVFSATKNNLSHEITVHGKLSGLAMSTTGNVAYTTVESAKETDAISLATGKVLWTQKGMLSNRWAVIMR